MMQFLIDLITRSIVNFLVITGLSGTLWSPFFQTSAQTITNPNGQSSEGTHSESFPLASLPPELRSMVYDQLIKSDETSLITMASSSKQFQKDVGSVSGYHTEWVKIQSLEQLKKDFTPNVKLLKVRFTNPEMSKTEFINCMANTRLSLVEDIDVEDLQVLSEQEKNEFTNSMFKIITHRQWIDTVAFSPDGKKFVTGSFDRTAGIWDEGTGQLIHYLVGHSAEVVSALFSPDGLKVVTSSDDFTARVWNVETGALLLTLSGHTNVVNSASFSPDSKRIITASDDRTVRIWDAETGAQLQVFSQHARPVWNATFSPESDQILIVTSGNFRAEIWNAKTQQFIRSFPGYSSLLFSAYFSSDGKKLLTASKNNTVRIWDVETGTEICKLAWNSSPVFGAMFSSDGKKVLTIPAGDGLVLVWDAGTGELIYLLDSQTRNLISASFSENSNKIITGADDGTVRIWNLKGVFRQYESRRAR